MIAKNTKKSSNKHKDINSQILQDPIKFCQLAWPHLTLYDKQVDVLKSVKQDKETFVHAGNKLGKDFIAGICVLWFFCSRDPVRVIASSSGQHQLENVLWREIKTRIEDSVIDLGIETTHLRVLKNDGHSKSYVIGIVTNKVENLQGYHLGGRSIQDTTPRTLYIADEASGIDDEFHEAAQSWADRMLVIGNPMNTTNFFYRGCKRGTIKSEQSASTSNTRKVLHIGAEHSPNVVIAKKLKEAGVGGPYPRVLDGVLSYEEYCERLNLWDKIKQQMRLHGKFYEGAEELLYPPDWLDAAEEAYERLNPKGYDDTVGAVLGRTDTRWMGVDTGAGRDLTVWTIIDRKGVLTQLEKQTPDTVEITHRTLNLIQTYSLSPENICFDAGGGGKQISDRLKELGYMVRAIHFGSAATPPASMSLGASRLPSLRTEYAEKKQSYKNRRAEMYGYLRLLLDPSVAAFDDTWFAIPKELYRLRDELSIMPLQYSSEGKLELPPKDRRAGQKDTPQLKTIRKLLGHSPDRADSLVLAVFAMMVKGRKVAGAM